MRIFRLAGWLGLGSLLVLVSLSDFLAHAPADTRDAGPALSPPSHLYPFGTDVLGRDVMSEALHALSLTMSHVLLGSVVALVFSAFAGMVAARLPLLLRGPLRWAVGIMAALPALLLAMLFVGLASRASADIAAGLAVAPLGFARAFDAVRAQDRTRHAAFARATGISAMVLLRRDLVTDYRRNFLTLAARAFFGVTIAFSSLSFLGFGTVPPHRDLGLVIAAARTSYLTAWWTALFPALALLLLILCARLAGGAEESTAP
ncbi:MAG TPA: hypothetical protein VIJ72_01985 [Rhizomicrobium sp.]